MDGALENRLKELNDSFLTENAKLNLSAFRAPEQSYTGNVLDSLAFVDIVKRLYPKEPDSLRVLDVGTGGGFPLLPLALAFPRWSFTGLDATRKKIDAIGRIVAAMGITNVRLLCGRSEELGHDADLRESFDVVLARALAPLPTLMEYTSPFAAVGGKCVYWKSLKIADEQRASAAAMMQLKLVPQSAHTYTLPGDWGTRQLLAYEKTAALPAEYPRRTGVPQKEPL